MDADLHKIYVILGILGQEGQATRCWRV